MGDTYCSFQAGFAEKLVLDFTDKGKGSCTKSGYRIESMELYRQRTAVTYKSSGLDTKITGTELLFLAVGMLP